MNAFYKAKGLSRIPLLGILCLSIISACLDKPLEMVEDGTPNGTVWKLNKNVNGLESLANVCMTSDSIAIFNIKYLEDGSVLYWLSMKECGDIELYSEIVSDEVLVPELSMNWEGDSFFWIVNGVFLTDSEGNRVAVNDQTKPVSFLLRDESVCCKVKNKIVGEYPVTKADYLAKDVAFEYDSDIEAFNMHLSSGFTMAIPTISEFHLLDENVLNRSFYRDVFLDAGIELNSRSALPAADYLGLSLESISFPLHDYTSKDKSFQIMESGIDQYSNHWLQNYSLNFPISLFFSPT